MAKTYTWTAPLAQVVNVVATPSAGGSLAASTTYYYRVVAVTQATGADEQVQDRIWGQASAEVSATTDAVNKTIGLTWDAVAGADAYYVFRSTTSGNYSGSCKLNRISDNGTDQPTVATNAATDAGTTTLRTTNCMVVMPAATPLIDGLDITQYYGGKLAVYGGDSGDPVTFKNIYDWMVTNVANYQNYVYFDGYTFTCLFDLDFFGGGTNAIYFKDTNKVVKITKKTVFGNVVSGSVIQFGERETGSNRPKNGIRFVQQGSRVAISAFGDAVYAYDCDFYSLLGESYWNPTGSSNISGANYWDINNAVVVDKFSVQNVGNGRVNTNASKKNIDFFSSTCEVNAVVQDLLWKLSVKLYFSYAVGVTGTHRIDESTSYGTDAQFQYSIRNNTAAAQIIKAVDPICPNSSHAEKLPNGFSWTGTTDNGAVKVYYSLLYNTVDEHGNAIAGAAMTIKDVDGNAAVEFGGTAITELISDSDGYFYREKINITAVGTNTITDSSKSWTTNEWRGRNVRINETGEIYKVLSNTGTVLTFTEDILDAPSTSTQAGIILEVLRRNHIHTPSGAATATTTTDYAPFVMKTDKAGYLSIRDEISPNKKTVSTTNMKRRRNGDIKR